MALFSSLSERLNHIFSKLTKRGKLTELEIKTAMREVRVALLEADVNLKVAKQFIADDSEKAVGQEILASLNPAKVVTDTFYSLYYYDSLVPFAEKVGLLLAMTAVVFAVSALFVRRQRYASL